MSHTSPHRYAEIDLLRTLAIIMMVIYHGIYDLAVFGGWEIDPFTGGWWIFARLTATLFLSLSGLSFRLSRHVRGNPPLHLTWKHELRRAGTLATAALLVTVVTYIVLPEQYVRFGILHLIATGTVLLIVLDRLRGRNVLIGLAVLLLGQWVAGMNVETSLLIPVGFPVAGFATVDYFPLLPWFGVMLIGNSLGHILYSRNSIPRSFSFPLSHILSWPGRHSLAIYLLHQPVMLGLLWVIGIV